MRNEFITCKYYYQARKACLWASIIIKVEGGYKAFECLNEYATYKKQR